jgi:hypothetical protein
MIELEQITDPIENAFTVSVPRGWNNRAWLERRGAAVHNLVLTSSPDGSTAMFIGDGRLPYFLDPNQTPFPPPGSVLRPFTSIEHFLPAYAQDRFGRLPGLRFIQMQPAPALHQLATQMLVRSGAPQSWVTAGRLTFEYSENGARIQGLLYGTTISLAPMWWAEIMGLSTTGEIAEYEELLFTIYKSRAATPEMHRRQMAERAQSAAAHQTTMAGLEMNAAILRSNHANNMGILNNMASAHQQRMDTLHNSHDAANAAWQERQQQQDSRPSSADAGQRRFLNMIAEERTVVDSEGQTHQIAAGYDRYFRRRSDGVWIGTHGDRDLRGVSGINPDDFEELKIKI